MTNGKNYLVALGTAMPTGEYAQALKEQPRIVFIRLGTGDERLIRRVHAQPSNGPLIG